MNTMLMTRRSLVTGLAASALLVHSRPLQAQDLPKIVVSKTQTVRRAILLAEGGLGCVSAVTIPPSNMDL
jgi:hypothetical protein